MAGTNADFNAADFRSNIRTVYTMALPTVTADQPAFVMPKTVTYNKPVDGEDVPFDPTAAPTTTGGTNVQVPCQVIYQDEAGEELPFGTVTPSRIVVTLLDVDYALIAGCTGVIIAGDLYVYRHTETPAALFDVGLYSLHFLAHNEV